MSTTTKWIIAVIVIAAVILGLWWNGIIGNRAAPGNAQSAAAVKSAPLDTSDATIGAEAAAIDAQMRVAENQFSDFRYAPTAAKTGLITNQFGSVGVLIRRVASRLQARTSVLKSLGLNTNTLQSAVSDMGIQISYATEQTSLADQIAAKIKPDNGDALRDNQNNALFEQVITELDKARGYLYAAIKDIKTAIAGFKTTK